MLEAFATSTAIVALAEVGDKTQLLSFFLAARLRRPIPIILGILVATLANHALAGSVGVWLARLLPPTWLPWMIGVTFIAFGIWALYPDSLDDSSKVPRGSAFVATTLAFFVAEMGDKTQLATVALAARFDALAAVVIATTAGMLVANVPAVLIGEQLAQRLPMKAIRIAAALVFIITGVLTLIGMPADAGTK